MESNMTQSTTSNKIDQQAHQKNVITFRYPGTKEIVYEAKRSTATSELSEADIVKSISSLFK